MKHQARLRTAVFLTLLAAGLLGMLATGSGVWPGPTGPWLALLGTGLLWHAANRRVAANKRLLRRLEANEHATLERDKVHELALTDMGTRVDAMGTPEGMRRLVENQNRMGEALSKVEEWQRVEDQRAQIRRIQNG